jgi:hypothetical protein
LPSPSHDNTPAILSESAFDRDLELAFKDGFDADLGLALDHELDRDLSFHDLDHDVDRDHSASSVDSSFAGAGGIDNQHIATTSSSAPSTSAPSSSSSKTIAAVARTVDQIYDKYRDLHEQTRKRKRSTEHDDDDDASILLANLKKIRAFDAMFEDLGHLKRMMRRTSSSSSSLI